MGLFDDDFYSTRVKRRIRTGKRNNSRPFARRGQSSTFRIAFISSVASSLLVVLLFVAINGGGGERGSEARPALTGGQALVETSERIISASEKVRPAVVSIVNLTNQAMAEQDLGDNPDDGEIMNNANLGSGVIFQKTDGKAYIITNAHVIDDAAVVQAVLINGDRKAATIIGKDVVTDLAVLQVDGKGIDTVVDIGNSSKLRDGEMVIAVGNPLGFGDSLTQGIVSNKKRIIAVSLNQDGIYDWEQEVIQIDAAINQGNSGGALVDLNGKLVGINSMKVADTGVEGIGFAIPIDNAMPILKSLMEKGKVSRPYMGLYSMDLGLYLDSSKDDGINDDPNDETNKGKEEDGEFEVAAPVIPDGIKSGIIVLEAVGPSLAAGLQFNDIVVALDGKPIKSTMDLRKYLYNSKKIGESMKVTYYRDGKKQTLEVKLTEKVEQSEER
ncbi:S1C family serine protease [Cohnella abietis]|nr:trypsin-like peptidase domain-containing protein [Cohnella abietis]